jgi:hypothetical protein
MTDEEILRTLRTVRYSSKHERNARRALSINGLATMTGLTRQALYQILWTGHVGSRSRPALSKALQNL